LFFDALRSLQIDIAGELRPSWGEFPSQQLKIDEATGDAPLDLPLVAFKCHEQQKP